jgi:serine/threonine protein phosphatase 1
MLGKLFKSKQAVENTAFNAPLEPETPFYVIGDVHGCETLLEQLIEKIGQDSPLGPKAKIVFVGDYIDRGENSAQVLNWVCNLTQNPNHDVTCLMGNHEDMLLKFLDDPEERGARWVRYGGLQTLASFGVGGVNASSTADALIRARDTLSDAMGSELIKWLADLPLYSQNGNVAVVHAAADPALPLSDQHPTVLKWGHKDFMKQARTDDVWIVHGHTIVDEANDTQGRIAIDTGAFATRKLTAVCIEPGGPRYLQS